MVSTTQRRTTPRLSASGAVAVATTPTNRSARRPPPSPRVSLLEREGHDARRCRYCCRLAPHFFLSKKEERERERERELFSFFFTFCVEKMGKNGKKWWKKWTCFFFKFSVFYCLTRREEEREAPPPSKQQKFLCTPLSSLLLDFLILRPNKNDALGAKVCIVSSSSSSSSSSSFSEGKLALVETNREKREEDIFSRDAWSPRVRFRSRRPRRPRRRRVDFSRRRQHRRRQHRRDVRITRPPVHFRARVGAATITTKKNEKVSAPRRIFYITAVERSATTTTIITRRVREEDV